MPHTDCGGRGLRLPERNTRSFYAEDVPDVNVTLPVVHHDWRPVQFVFRSTSIDTAPSIDGFKDPTLIPDAIAFDHFFSVLRAGQSTPQAADARRRSYLRFYLRPGCGPGANEDRTLTDSQIDGLLKFVDRLDAQLKTVEQEIVLIQSQSKGPSTSSSLAALQISRTDLIKSAASSLGSELDADTARKINQHVNEHVKRQIKIYSLP